MKVKTKKTEKEESGWIMLIQNFIENKLSQLGSNIMGKVDAWLEDLRIKAISYTFIVIGLVFFLLGLSLGINALAGDGLQWIGFSLTGLIAMIAGLMLVRK